MFGQNPIRSQEHDPQRLAVEAVFGPTIQGEGPEGGRRALFIRLAGCNLACHFCDTQFESQAENYRPVQEVIEEIHHRFTEEQRAFVVLTGGEPMRQNFLSLLDGLAHYGTKHVQIETAGTLWVEGLEQYTEGWKAPRVTIVCSPKTPRLNINVLAACQDWKYIVRAGEASEVDGLPRRGTQLATRDRIQHVFRPFHLSGEQTIWLSPMDEYDEVKNKANLQAARDLVLQWGYRLSIQLHKLVEVE